MPSTSLANGFGNLANMEIDSTIAISQLLAQSEVQTEAQVRLLNGASDQVEAVVSTLLEGISGGLAEGVGANLDIVA